jgi:hypothetical protein
MMVSKGLMEALSFEMLVGATSQTAVIPAKSGYPVRRRFSVGIPASLGYRVTRFRG